MQKQNNIEDFDLQVRELLRDAELRAPAGSWSAVSARLRTKESRRPYWAWAGAAMAFAALAALGVFFFHSTKPLEQGAAISAISEPMVAQAVIPQVEVVEQLVFGLGAEMQTAQVAIAVPEQWAAAEEAALSENAAISGNTASSDRTESASEPHADPFALMELQDRMAQRKAGKRPSMYAGGLLSSNQGSSSGTWMGASGLESLSLTRTGVENYGIPVSFGVGVKVPLGSKFSVGSGLSYTLLSSTFQASYMGSDGDATHNMHYLGIPVNIYYDILRNRNVKFYVYGGGAAEYCVANNYIFHGSASSIRMSEAVKGLQWSAGVGLGVEFMLSRSIGLYIDPSARYYFHSGHPQNIRTVKPQTFNFEAGLRFDL